MKKVNPKWFRHEALDRTHVVLSCLNDHLLEHTYYDSGINPKYSKHILDALESLHKAYQACVKENEVKKKIEVD